MPQLKVIDKIMIYVQKNQGAVDTALNKMAIDIERTSKLQVPVKTGALKTSGLHKKIGLMHWQVSYNKIYAAFQEFGGDATRTVRHYSQPGKKSFYLRDPGQEIGKKALDYIRREVKNVNVGL